MTLYVSHYIQNSFNNIYLVTTMFKENSLRKITQENLCYIYDTDIQNRTLQWNNLMFIFQCSLSEISNFMYFQG